MFEFPHSSQLDFCLWGKMKCEVYERRADTRDELLVISHCGCCWPHKERRRSTETKDAAIAQGLQSALSFAVGFLNIYGELQRTCHFCVTNFSFKHWIRIKIKINFNFSWFITIHVLRFFTCWTFRPEFHRGHGCLSVWMLCVVRLRALHRADRSSRGFLPECGVSECDSEASIMRRHWPTRGCCAMEKLLYTIRLYL